MHIAVPTRSGLIPKEHNFCHFIVAEPNMCPTEAMLKMKPDMKRKSAYNAGLRMLQSDKVREYIGVLLEARQKRLEMDEDWVVANLRNVYDRCMQNEPVYGAGSAVLDENGEDTGESVPLYYKFDSAGSIKSLELIGKHMKMFSDKTAAGSTTVSIKINLGNDSQGEAKPVIEGDFKRVGSN